MTESGSKLTVTSETPAERPARGSDWRPLETLRRDIDQFIDDIGRSLRSVPFGLSGSLTTPFASGALSWPTGPAADMVGKPTRYEITAELPGMDEKDIEVKVTDGTLTIRGEKRHEREETKEGYYLAERRFGAFERAFRLPQGVDAGRIEAVLRNGVLTVTLPKIPEAKAETTVAVQAA